jgi:putative ABC transport system permease protein
MKRFKGRFRSALIIGGQGIRARKMRTFLSMISLFMGVMAVILVQAAASTAESAVRANVEMTEGPDGTILMNLPNMNGSVPIVLEELRGKTGAVATILGRAIIGEPNVRPVNPGAAPFENGRALDYGGPPIICDATGNCRVDESAPRETSGAAIEVELMAITGDIRAFRPYRAESGEWLDFASQPSLAPRLVLNRQAAEGFALHRVPAEMRVDGAIANTTPRVVGVMDDSGYQPRAYMRADELLNWLPESALNSTQGSGAFYDITVLFSPEAADLVPALRAKLTGLGLPADAIRVNTVDVEKQLGKEIQIVRYVFLGLASLVLLIGVAGILNVGLATVGERVEEFALRRAVGMSRLLLAGIVLAETLLTGLLTAAAAIGLAAAAMPVAASMIGEQEPALRNLTFPWEAGVAGVIAGLCAGILGGLIPAIRAARIPIATVMRA